MSLWRQWRTQSLQEICREWRRRAPPRLAGGDSRQPMSPAMPCRYVTGASLPTIPWRISAPPAAPRSGSAIITRPGSRLPRWGKRPARGWGRQRSFREAACWATSSSASSKTPALRPSIFTDFIAIIAASARCHPRRRRPRRPIPRRLRRLTERILQHPSGAIPSPTWNLAATGWTGRASPGATPPCCKQSNGGAPGQADGQACSPSALRCVYPAVAAPPQRNACRSPTAAGPLVRAGVGATCAVAESGVYYLGMTI